MPICPGNDDGQRDAMAFHQQMAFASFFSPYPPDSAQPPPVPKELWLRRYQYFAMTRICLPFRRIPPTRHARWREIPRPFPTGESRHGWNWDCHIFLWGRPSIGNRYGERRQYLQIPCDNLTVFCHHPVYGYKVYSGPLPVAAREAPHAPKKHRKQPMTATLACAPPIIN